MRLLAILCALILAQAQPASPDDSPQMPVAILLLRDLSQANTAEAIEFAKASGSQVGVAQDAWARSPEGYGIHPVHFPDGIEGLAQTVKRLQEAGLAVVLHVVEPYSLPVPNPGLKRVRVGTLARGMNRVVRRVPTKPVPGKLPKPSGKRVLQIDDELMTVEHGPFGFVGCERGAFGTSPREHALGASVYCLLEPPRLRMLADEAQQAATVARLAQVVKACGPDHIYFERNRQHEHVRSDLAAGLETALSRLVQPGRCLSSVPAQQSQEKRVTRVLRLLPHGQAGAQLNSALLDEPSGSPRCCAEWDWRPGLPSLIEAEQACLRALVWEVPLLIRASVHALARSESAARLLRLVGTYGRIGNQRAISLSAKAAVKKSPSQYIAAVREGRWRLLRGDKTVGLGNGAETSALLLRHGESTLVAYWHREADGKLFLPLAAKSVQVHDRLGRQVHVAARGDSTEVPIGDLRLLTVRDTSEAALLAALAKARVVTAKTLWLQAEGYESLAGKMAKGSKVGVRDEGAFGDFVVPTAASGPTRNENWHCRYRLSFPASDVWHVWGRVRYENTNTNSFSFAQGDGPNTAVKFGNDMVFRKWHWDQGPSLHYEKGVNVFRVYEREGSSDVTKSPRLDVICFTDDPNYRPNDKDAKLGLEYGL